MRLPPVDPSIEQTVVRSDFSPQRMVDWFSPIELARTGGRVVLASIFGSYADKREVQAALYSDTAIDSRYLNQSEMWFDYIADVGDGFDSTYTLAYILAYPEIPGPTSGPSTLKRGQVLFFGGDQVYPTASRDAYRDRMIGPYSHSSPECRRPNGNTGSFSHDLFAIPGNHDWYDGLTSFVRTFCQRRSLGSWQTRQRRSYFSIPLPHDWWLWGIDIQLEADIDDPQLDYFRETATQMRKRCQKECPKLILITAEPAWVHAGDHPRIGTIEYIPSAFDNLEFFLKQTVTQFDLDVRLIMAGDLHHYARYTRASGDETSSRAVEPSGTPVYSLPLHFVTAGGGGAYLSGTHHLYDRLRIPPCSSTQAVQGNRIEFQHSASYPSRPVSRTRTFGVFLLPLWSPYFSILVGLTYLLFAWQLQSSSRVVCPVEAHLSDPKPSLIVSRCWDSPASASGAFTLVPSSLMDVLLEGHSMRTALWWIARATLEAPSLLVEVSIFWWLLFAFCAARRQTRRAIVTTLHACLHVGLTAVAVWIGAAVVAYCYPDGGSYYSGQGKTGVFGSFMFAFGATIGTLAFAVYLWTCAHFVTGAPHMNEVFSARRYKDLKHFLRFHLDSNGRIHAHVVAVDRVVRAWKPAARPGSLYVPSSEPKCRVIDTFALD